MECISYVVQHSLLSQCHVLFTCKPPPPRSDLVPVSARPLTSVWPLFLMYHHSDAGLQFHCLEFSFIFLQRPAGACPCGNLANVGAQSVLTTGSTWALSPLSHKKSRQTRRVQLQESLQQPFSLFGASLLGLKVHLGANLTQNSLNVQTFVALVKKKKWNTFIFVYFGSL